MFDGKCFIIGGYSFGNNLASEIFHFNQVFELQIELGTHSKPTCSIYRMISLDVTGQHTINFCSVDACNHVLLFGGYSYPQYDPLKQDMYKFCPPKTNSNKRPKRESMLYDIDLSTLEVKCDLALLAGNLQLQMEPCRYKVNRRIIKLKICSLLEVAENGLTCIQLLILT